MTHLEFERIMWRLLNNPKYTQTINCKTKASAKEVYKRIQQRILVFSNYNEESTRG